MTMLRFRTQGEDTIEHTNITLLNGVGPPNITMGCWVSLCNFSSIPLLYYEGPQNESWMMSNGYEWQVLYGLHSNMQEEGIL